MKWFLALIIIGHGIKLGPVAILDEIALSVRSILHPVLTFQSFRFPGISCFGFCILWFLLIEVVGLVSSFNLNNIRYILLALSLAFAGRVSLDLPAIKWGLVASFVYLMLTIVLNIVEMSLGLFRFSWQEFLWTGTAYSSFGVLFATLFIISFSKGERLDILAAILFLASAFTNDSRLSLFYFPFIMLIICAKYAAVQRGLYSILKGVLKLALYVCLSILILGIFFKDTARTEAYSSIDTFSEIFLEDSGSRDEARRDQIRFVTAFLERESLPHVLFGYGGFSHQSGLVRYVGGDSSGLVRPVGIAAVVFDGGLLLLGLMALSTVECVWSVFKLRRKKTPLHLVMSASCLPIVAFASLLVTNLLDSVIFWLSLSQWGFAPCFVQGREREEGRSEQCR